MLLLCFQHFYFRFFIEQISFNEHDHFDTRAHTRRYARAPRRCCRAVWRREVAVKQLDVELPERQRLLRRRETGELLTDVRHAPPETRDDLRYRPNEASRWGTNF